MAKRDLLKLPRDFSATVKALLQTPPPPDRGTLKPPKRRKRKLARKKGKR